MSRKTAPIVATLILFGGTTAAAQDADADAEDAAPAQIQNPRATLVSRLQKTR